MQQTVDKSTLASLAILAVNFNKHPQENYIDIFVPFMCTLICKKNYQILPSLSELQAEFLKEFGLTLPIHPIKTIVERMKVLKYINAKNSENIVIPDKVRSKDFSSKVSKQIDKHSEVISAFAKFSRERFEISLDESEAEETAIGFFKNKDLDLLFFSEDKTLLPKVSVKKANQYIFDRFIKHTSENEPSLFASICDWALGHLVANCLFLRTSGGPEGKVRGLEIYLDTNLISKLLGFNGAESYSETVEFLDSLKKADAKLFIFSHTHKEITQILESAKRWIFSPHYDPAMASPAGRYFREKGFSQSDVERFIAGVLDKLAEKFIYIADSVEIEADQFQFSLDWKKLHDSIASAYGENFYFDESIWADINSISRIALIRKGQNPKTLKEAKAFFVTGNSTLARVCFSFQKDDTKSGEFFLSWCVTDTFLGTLVWIYDRKQFSEFSKNRLIAESYAALAPDESTFKAIVKELKKLKQQGAISESEFVALAETPVAKALMNERILGDFDRYTPDVPKEVLEKLMEKVASEHKEASELAKNKLKETILKHADRAESQRLLLKKIANILTGIFFLVLIVGYGFAIMACSGFIVNYWARVLSCALLVTFSIGLMFWTGKDIFEKIKSKIYKILMGQFLVEDA